MSATVTCVMPVYNSAEYLPEAIESVFAQTHAPAEVILVDDGSTQDIAAVVAESGREIVYIRKDNGGPASARNVGIERATSEWLTFLDADDKWHPRKTEIQLGLLESNTELDYSLTFKRQFWEASMAEEEAALRAQGHPVTTDAPGYVLQTMMIRRKDFLRVGLLDEDLRIGEDTDWIARAEDKGLRREIVEQVLVYRRMHETNLSYQGTSPEGLEDRKKIMLERAMRRLKSSD